MLTEPVPFELHLEAGLDDTIACKLDEGGLRKLVNLRLGLANTPMSCTRTLM
jgi:hypothetical protein